MLRVVKVCGVARRPARCGSTKVVHQLPYVHAETNVVFPQKLGDSSINMVTTFEDATLGRSLRYFNGTAASTLDMYRSDQDVADNDLHMLGQEMAWVMGEAQDMEKRGTYTDVVLSETASVRNLGHEDENVKAVLASVSFKLDGEGTDSLIALVAFRGHYFKLRDTVRDHGKIKRARRDLMVRMWAESIAETPARERLPRLLEAYREDPLSDQGSAACGEIFDIAHRSHVLSPELVTEEVPFKLGADTTPGTDAVLTALVMGSLSEQLATQSFERQPLAGIQEALRVYEEVRKFERITELEELRGVPAEELGSVLGLLGREGTSP